MALVIPFLIRIYYQMSRIRFYTKQGIPTLNYLLPLFGTTLRSLLILFKYKF